MSEAHIFPHVGIISYLPLGTNDGIHMFPQSLWLLAAKGLWGNISGFHHWVIKIPFEPNREASASAALSGAQIGIL